MWYRQLFPTAPEWAVWLCAYLFDVADKARQARDQHRAILFAEAGSRIFNLLQLHQQGGKIEIERAFREAIEALTGYSAT